MWWVAEYDNDVGIDCANDCSLRKAFQCCVSNNHSWNIHKTCRSTVYHGDDNADYCDGDDDVDYCDGAEDNDDDGDDDSGDNSNVFNKVMMKMSSKGSLIWWRLYSVNNSGPSGNWCLGFLIELKQ